ALEMSVVRIRSSQVTHRRLALYVNEVLVVVHVKDRLGRFDHAPHDHGRDLDRITILIVHLEPAAFEIAHAQRDVAAQGQRVYPPESLLLKRALVGPEQLDDLRLIRVNDRTAENADYNHGL